MNKVTLLILLSVVMIGCGSNPLSEFPMEKKFWDARDYDAVISRIKYHTEKGEKYPCYANPEKAPVFVKLVDKNNFTVVLEDNTLGVKHRDEFADMMFIHWKDMTKLYSGLDEQDKYIYPLEFVDVYRFGLDLQLLYFKIGNENILKEADNPNDPETVDIVRRNVQTMVDNYVNYLDLVNREKSLSPDAITRYVEGLNTQFKKLIDENPDANYSGMLSKTKLMMEKSASPELKSGLKSLADQLDAKVNKPKEDAAPPDSLKK